ncbi:MAG: prepilin-type N-terminal cleavage/methylation domain-containing protein, partial [Planctomycetota bacterium]
MRLMQIQSKAETSALRRAGFSLVEMLAVLLILSILITVLVTQLTGQGEVVKARMTESFMSGELGTAITTYETEFGRYPAARFLEDWGTEPNATNLGSEALILSLFRKEWGGAD